MVPSEGKASLKNPVTPPGIDPCTVRLVAQRLNHYAIPGLFKSANYRIIDFLKALLRSFCNEICEVTDTDHCLVARRSCGLSAEKRRTESFNLKSFKLKKAKNMK